MDLLNFESYSLLTLVIIFFTAGVVVFFSGAKLSKYADNLSEQTGIGRAFLGILLLGGITSLPEAVTTITASIDNNAGMAISNILGGVSMQITILAAVDFWQRKNPVSSSTSGIVIIMQGSLLMLLLALTGMFMLSPSFTIFNVGMGSILIFIVFLGSLYFSQKFDPYHWLSYHKSQTEQIQVSIDNLNQHLEKIRKTEGEDRVSAEHISVFDFLRRKGLLLAIVTLLITIAGYFVVRSSEAIANTTGVSTNFAGFVLVAITTSLPEISTVIGAIRLKRYDMAFSNIFGTNLFDVALIFIADLFFLNGAILHFSDNFTVKAAFLGVILTSIFVVGIATKSKKQILGIGYDSMSILLTYVLALFLLNKS